MIKKLTENSVKVCCGRTGCPVIEKIDEEHYKVTDDDGNTIVVKKEELKLMGDAVNAIDGDQQLING
tara:strand:+ start:511 stop:711 length:201 start_codon:yes stop_codon:yes gene_type:complete